MFPASYDVTFVLVIALYLVLLAGAVVLLVLLGRVLLWLARFLRVATRERELGYELALDGDVLDEARGRDAGRDAGPEERPAS